jgi:hypothetical protein
LAEDDQPPGRDARQGAISGVALRPDRRYCREKADAQRNHLRQDSGGSRMQPIIDVDSHFEPGDDWLDPYPALAARLPRLEPTRPRITGRRWRTCGRRAGSGSSAARRPTSSNAWATR